MQHRYSWHAELSDGRVIAEGGDLSGAVRFSLIPAATGSCIPRHDLVGVRMRRRFCRGFLRAFGGGLREYVHCVVTDHFRIYVRSTDGAALITPADYELYL